MKMKRWIIGLLVVLVLVGTAACAGAEPDIQSGNSGTSAEGGEHRFTTAVPAVAPSPAPAKADEAGVAHYATLPGDRMIIRSGDLYLVVEDVNLTMQSIARFAEAYGGYVVTSNRWLDRDRMMGNISIRVAAERFNEAMAAVRNLAVEVRSESTSGQDVTEEYVDLSAQLETLEASADQLLSLMDRAGTIEEILEVQRELTKTNTQIEQVKGRMQYLEQSSATSLISVNLEMSKLAVEFTADTRTVKEGAKVLFWATVSGGFGPYSYEWDFGDGVTSTEERPAHDFNDDGAYTVILKLTDDRGTSLTLEREDYITVLPGWNAGNVVDAAVNGFVGFVRGLVNIIIWLGIFSPVWIVIGVILYFTWWRRRKSA